MFPLLGNDASSPIGSPLMLADQGSKWHVSAVVSRLAVTASVEIDPPGNERPEGWKIHVWHSLLVALSCFQDPNFKSLELTPCFFHQSIARSFLLLIINHDLKYHHQCHQYWVLTIINQPFVGQPTISWPPPGLSFAGQPSISLNPTSAARCPSAVPRLRGLGCLQQMRRMKMFQCHG